MKQIVNYFTFTALALISFAVLISCSRDAQMQPLSSNATILAFGDSLTYGTGTSRDKTYPTILEKLTGLKVINAGVPGEVSSAGLMRLPSLLRKHQPDLIIICHGGNDILRKLDMTKASDNIQKMITLAREHNTQVLLVGVPEFGLFLTSSPIYKTLAEQNHIPIANEIIGEILSKFKLKSDHIHPNTQGYQQLAERIAMLLKETGALVDP